jgi:potassium-transporting ATPase potassium-binding subunit
VDWSLLHPFCALGLPIGASLPLGWLMSKALDPPAGRVGRGVDAVPMFLLRLFGHRQPAEMGWRRYATSLLAFNVALFVISFAVLWAQGVLPLNPDNKGPLTELGYKDAAGVEHKGADTAVIFNTVCSFVTNTNLQHYSGEQHLSYFSQLGGIVWLQFVTPACGLAVMLAVIRGLRGEKHLGDFYLDTARSLILVLIPLALVVAVLLVSTGMPMTFHGAVKAATLDGGSQTIAVGPVAAEVAIKQLGTNGGGFFGPNSTHPFENPTPWSNILEVVSIILIPMASIVMFGRMIKDRAHAAVVYGVMLALLLTGVGIAIWAELQPSAATAGLPVARGGNMEGKEVRTGPVAGATWAAITTATSNGSVNSMHDSFQPLGGVVPMSLMMLNVDFSGIGAGFLNMLMYVITAVFLAGLMVGRTPEYLGKKIEAKEVKLAMLAILIHPLLICCGAALFAAIDWGHAATANPGPHGFSEILYEFTSASANNGSGFEGLADNSPPWNIATGIVLLLGRFPALVLPIAIAGFLAQKKRVPPSSGTLLTNDLTFAAMLLGTVLLVGALSFMPAVVLGPIADHLSVAAAAP